MGSPTLASRTSVRGPSVTRETSFAGNLRLQHRNSFDRGSDLVYLRIKHVYLSQSKVVKEYLLIAPVISGCVTLRKHFVCNICIEIRSFMEQLSG